MGGIRHLCAVLVLAIVFLAGCGSSRPAASRPTTTTTAAPVAPTVGTVKSISAGPGVDQLTLIIGSLPTATAPSSCAVTETAEPFEFPNEIRLSIEVMQPSGFDPTICGLTGERSLVVQLTQPPGERPVSFNVTGSPERYNPTPRGYVACSAPACDPSKTILEPGTCANLRDAVSGADVPAHFQMPLVRCDESWATTDIDYSAGACAPTDGGPRPCAGNRCIACSGAQHRRVGK